MTKNLLKFGAVMAVAFGVHSIANAAAILTLSDGLGDSVSLSDAGALTLLGAGTTMSDTFSAGTVQWDGSLGGWSVNVDSGSTTGTTTVPGLRLGFSDTSSVGGHLTITWSENGFGPSSGGFNTGVAGTLAGGNVVLSTFYSTANTLPAGTILASSIGTGGSGAFSESGSANVGSLPASYSLTEQLVITNVVAGTSSGNATLVAVAPDSGSTMILLGLGLCALGIYGGLRLKGSSVA